MRCSPSLLATILLALWPTSGRAQTFDETKAAVAHELRVRLEVLRSDHWQVAGQTIYSLQELPRFYEERLYQPAWIDGPHLPLARDLVRALEESEREGLRPEHYHLQALKSLLEEMRRTTPVPHQLLGDLELLLTDAFLIFGAHLVSGRVDPATFDPEWAAARREVDLVAALRRAIDERRPRDALQELLPTNPGYTKLRQGLARYRELDPWDLIPAEPIPLESGDPRVSALRLRLRASGDLAAPASGPRAMEESSLDLDPELDRAIRAFQRRHGLGDDGVVGSRTLEALNVPLSKRVQQIRLNLERWRWLPRELGPRHVLVDIPAFSLQVVEGSSEVLRMRVVVGRAYRRTPVMSDLIRYLVLNPAWEIPPRLAVQDKLPAIRKDPGYLAAQGIQVFSGWGRDEKEIDPATIDWQALGPKSFPYRLRQAPGPLNALGTVKFMFPNPFQVYLHDTPTKSHFNRPERAASSGCIRVEKPLELTEYLLRGAPGWSLATIQQVLDSGETRTVPLPERIPVHLQYWTATADAEGVVQFRTDVYDRDSALATALALPPPGEDP